MSPAHSPHALHPLHHRPVNYHINDLPDDCLILILRQCELPLQRLISLRAVCRRWHSVIIDQICHRKRNLKLFGTLDNLITYCSFLTENGLESDDDYRLKPVGKDDDLLIRIDCEHDYLVDLFPNVENLVLYLTRFSSRTFHMPILPRLTSLTLIYMPYPIGFQHQVWEAINAMHSLRSLNLFYIFQCTVPDHMPILGQLRSFSLDGYYGDIVSVLGQLSGALTTLHLDDVHCSVDQLQQVLVRAPAIAASLTSLTMGSVCTVKPAITPQKRRQIFDFICARFQALAYLAFTSYATYTLDDIVASLKRLPSLVELHLPNSWSGNLVNLANCTTKLTPVRRLYLNFSTATDQPAEEFPHLDLFSIFPSLEELSVIGGAKLLADAEHRLAPLYKWQLCQTNFRFKCEDICKHIGRHQERYAKYVHDLGY